MSLAFLTIAFRVVALSIPRMWQLVRTKLTSGFVSGFAPSRRAHLTCSRATSLVLFTTVLDVPAMVLAANWTEGKLTDSSWEERGEGGRSGEGGLGVGEVARRAPAATPAPAWVRDGPEFCPPLRPLTILFLSCSISWSFFLQFPFSFRFLELYRTSLGLGFRVYPSDLHTMPYVPEPFLPTLI